MEDKLFDRLRESSKLYGDEEMPESALHSYRAYVANKTKANSGNKSLLLTLLALLLLSNGIWVWNLSKNKGNGDSTNFTTVEVVKRDTIYITKEVFLSNNINDNAKNNIKSLSSELYRQKRIASNQILDFKSQIKILNDKLADYDRNSTVKDKNSILNYTTFNDGIPNLTNTSSSTKTSDRSIVDQLDQLSKQEVSLLNIPKPVIKINFDPIVIKFDKKQTFAELIKPKSMSLYGGLGIVQQTPNRYAALNGQNYSLGATSLMSNRWRYVLSFDYSRLNGELEENGVLPNISIPETPMGYTLEEIYLSQNNWGGSIGVDYLLKRYKFLRPFIGVLYQYRRSQFTGILFKYEGEFSDEIEIVVPNGNWNNQNVIGLRTGLDFNLWRSVDAYLGINYNHNLSNYENHTFKLNAGMYYHF